jgi:hypothetical protein
MLFLAEDDWLGHIFVALFQEQTAAFSHQADSLYHEVASAYQLESFFDSWKKHISLDNDLGHASHFLSFFDKNEYIRTRHLLKSIANAAITVTFMISTLDQILDEDALDADTPLRLPVCLSRLTKHHTSLLLTLPCSDSLSLNELVDSSSKVFYEQLLHMIASDVCIDLQASADYCQWICGSIMRSIARALSFSTCHEDILALGDILHLYSYLSNLSNGYAENLSSDDIGHSPILASLCNYMTQVATSPRIFFALLGVAYTYCQTNSDCVQFLDRSKLTLVVNASGRVLAWFEQAELLSHERVEILNKALIFRELFFLSKSPSLCLSLGSNPFGACMHKL